MAQQQPTIAQIQQRLSKSITLSTEFSGIGYRSSSPNYSNENDLLTGEGSKRHGGRWNPVGLSVVYLSLSPETAMAETLAHYRYYGIPIEEAMPRTFVAIDIRLQAVLDLRIGGIRQRLQLSEERMLNIDWRKEVQGGHCPLTQQIGLAVEQLGWEGLIVPSAADSKGHNLLVFPHKLRAGGYLRVRNEHALKP